MVRGKKNKNIKKITRYDFVKPYQTLLNLNQFNCILPICDLPAKPLHTYPDHKRTRENVYLSMCRMTCE